MHWYCTTCRKEVEAEDGAVVACAAGTCRLQPDRRIFEPDLPAMGSTPSDEWVAVYQPRDANTSCAGSFRPPERRTFFRRLTFNFSIGQAF